MLNHNRGNKPASRVKVAVCQGRRRQGCSPRLLELQNEAAREYRRVDQELPDAGAEARLCSLAGWSALSARRCMRPRPGAHLLLALPGWFRS